MNYLSLLKEVRPRGGEDLGVYPPVRCVLECMLRRHFLAVSPGLCVSGNHGVQCESCRRRDADSGPVIGLISRPMTF